MFTNILTSNSKVCQIKVMSYFIGEDVLLIGYEGSVHHIELSMKNIHGDNNINIPAFR